MGGEDSVLATPRLQPAGVAVRGSRDTGDVGGTERTRGFTPVELSQRMHTQLRWGANNMIRCALVKVLACT